MRISSNRATFVSLAALVLSLVGGCGGGGGRSSGGGGGTPIGPGISLTDESGAAIGSVLADGSDLSIVASGLEARKSIEVLVNGPGAGYKLPTGEVVQGYFRLSLDKEGNLPKFELMKQPLPGEYQVTTRYHGSSGGQKQSFVVQPVAGRPVIRVGSTDGTNFVRSSVLATGDNLAVQASGLNPGPVDVYVVAHDPTGALGPTLTDVSGYVPDDSVPVRGLTGTAETAQVASDGTLGPVTVWNKIEAQAATESFDIVLDLDRDGVFDEGSDIRQAPGTPSVTVSLSSSRTTPGSEEDLASNSITKQATFSTNTSVFVGNYVTPRAPQTVMVSTFVLPLAELAAGMTLKDVSGPLGSSQPETYLQQQGTSIAFVKAAVYPADLRPGKYAIVIDLNGNGVFDLGVDAVDGLDGSPAFFTDVALSRQKWTVMVYIDADNDLEGHLLNDLDEMEIPKYVSGANDSEVTVCAQMDRIPGFDNSNGDWTTTRRFVMAHDTTVGYVKTEPFEDLGEQDMGNPATLRSFIQWAKQTAPADHYALIISSHGNGPRSRSGEPILPITRGIGADLTSSLSMLTPAELGDVIRGTGKVEVLGLDACLMANAEVLTQVQDCTDYVVASETLFPATSFDYDSLLTELVANPNMTGRELAIKIIDTNRPQYANSDWVVLTAFDMSRMPTLVSAINAFSSYMLKDPGNGKMPMLYYDDGVWTSMLTGRRSDTVPTVLSHLGPVDEEKADDMSDLKKLMMTISETSDMGFVRGLASNVVKGIDEMILANITSTRLVDKRFGLSVWLPKQKHWDKEKTAYTQLTMSRLTQWDELVHKVLQAKHVFEIKAGSPTGPFDGYHVYTLSEDEALDDAFSFEPGFDDGYLVGSGDFHIVTDRPITERRIICAQYVYPTDWVSPPRWRIETATVDAYMLLPDVTRREHITEKGWEDRENIEWNVWMPFTLEPDGSYNILNGMRSGGN